MDVREMIQMRVDGVSLQKIADTAGVSKQRVEQKINSYVAKNAVFMNRDTQLRLSGFRGSTFNIEDIAYEGIYEHFVNTPDESMHTFTLKVYEVRCDGRNTQLMRNFIQGKTDSRLSVSKIKKICEVVGKSFEEVFKEREVKKGVYSWKNRN